MIRQWYRWTALSLFALLPACRAMGQVSLYTVVDLALRNSTQVRMAQADVMRAAAGLAQTKDAYIPNFVLGTSPGYSYGFPIGQPSIFNVESNSLLFTFSQPEYVRSARAALKSAQFNLKDSKDQVIFDASVDYIQLSKSEASLAVLNQEKEYAEKLVGIEQDRVIAGVEPHIELTRAQLTAAQINLKLLHMQNDADHLRQELANLTGMPADSLMTEKSSIPAQPDIAPTEDLRQAIATKNAGILAADADAISKHHMSLGDERQNYRPQLAFGAEYSRYAKFNNYAEYYQRFQHNNFGIGVQITIPLFDISRRAKAHESDAIAAHATAQAEQARNTMNEQTIQLQKSLTELAAQRQVAQLQAQLAQDQLEIVETQLANGSGAPNAAVVTPKDEQQTHIQERERYADMLDAEFSLTRAELGLLRAIGSIEDWARSTPKTETISSAP